MSEIHRCVRSLWRGNRRQDIVVDDLDRDTFFERIGLTVEKYGWQMLSSVLMTNHFHLFFRTPQPNLSRGMQFLLGGYVSWWNWRHDLTWLILTPMQP